MGRFYRYNASKGLVEEFTPCEPEARTELNIKANLAYESPVTGQAVTSWRARDYDLKASGCVPYEQAKDMAVDGRRNRKTLTHGLSYGDIKPYLRNHD